MDKKEKLKWKARRREYIRQERASVRREKRKLRRRIRKERLRRLKRLLIDGLFLQKKDTSEEQNLQQRKNEAYRRKKKYKKEERESIRRERREMRRKTKHQRIRMRRARMEHVRKSLLSFLRNPLPSRKRSKSQRFILREVRKERRRRFLKQLYTVPARLTASIYRFWLKRFRWANRTANEIHRFFRDLLYELRDKRIRGIYLKTAVNSTVFFTIAFLLMYYLSQYITIVTASFYEIPTVLFSYRIYWPLYTYSTLYTRSALIVIFGMGPLVCLILGFVFYRLFLFLRSKLVYLKTLLIWLVIHAVNMFFGAYVVGVVTRTGFIYTSEWLFLSNVFDVEEIVLLIVSLVMLLITGYFATKHFLTSAVSMEMIEPRRRLYYVIFQVLVPWLVGNFVLALMNIPDNPDELLLLYATTALVIIPVFASYNSMSFQQIRIPKVASRVRIQWGYLVLMIIAVLLIRFGLSGGYSYG